METALQRHAETGAVRGPSLSAPKRAARLRPGTAWALSCLGVDATMLGLTAIATAVGSSGSISTPGAGWMLVFGVLCVLFYASRRLYAARLKVRAIDDVVSIAKATTIAAMSLLSLRLLVGDHVDLLAESVRPWAFALVYVSAGRVALYWSQARARSQGESVRPTLVVGAGKVGTLIAKRLLDSPDLGLRPVAFLDKDPLADTRGLVGLPVVGASWDLDEVVDRYGIQQVIVTFSTAPEEVLLRLVRRCEERGIAVAVVPRLFERMPEHVTIDHLGGLPLVSPRAVDPRDWQFDLKYALDRVVAAGALLVLSPLLIVLSLAILATMGRPVLFRQLRVGRDGRTFQMLKFRSMLEPSADPDLPVLPEGLAPGGVEGDDRRTRLGAFLRRSSIDELPQLVNVLRGEMSIVGPRPLIPSEDRHVRNWQRRRLDLKPGITGLWQALGASRIPFEEMVKLDYLYVKNWSLLTDVKLMLRTVAVLLRTNGD